MPWKIHVLLRKLLPGSAHAYVLYLISSYNVAGVLPRYFSSEWSFAQFHVPEVTQFFAAFGAQNTIAIIGMDGR